MLVIAIIYYANWSLIWSFGRACQLKISITGFIYFGMNLELVFWERIKSTYLSGLSTSMDERKMLWKRKKPNFFLVLLGEPSRSWRIGVKSLYLNTYLNSQHNIAATKMNHLLNLCKWMWFINTTSVFSTCFLKGLVSPWKHKDWTN